MLILSALLALSVPTPALSASVDEISPPGLTLIPGRRVKIGSDVKDVETLFLDPKYRSVVNTLIAETPQHEVKIPDFYLMVSEVTNEQYAEYVKQGGGRPPQSWGRAAIDAAQREYVAKVGEQRKEALARGKRGFDAPDFERAHWWSKNWASSEWKIPRNAELQPVTYVDYQSASGYARWAGLRLMTEFEYQAACRGKTTNTYPWGNDWDDKRFCASVLYGQDDAFPVGSFPDGASPEGIFDLAGNVWEWTSSPFRSFPGYKPYNKKHGKGGNKDRIEALAAFDANQRVAVGGSYKNSPIGLRCTTRRGSERSQATDSLGFRCAASTLRGADIAQVVLNEDLPPSSLPENVEYRADRCLAMDRWTTAQGSEGPEGYGVISGYDAVLFVPVDRLRSSTLKDLRRKSTEDGPVHVGAFSTTRKLIQPELEAGSYMVAFRGRGEIAEQDEDADMDADEAEAAAAPAVDPAEDPLGAMLDLKTDNLIFFDSSMKFVAALPIAPPEKKSMKASTGTIDVESIPPMTPAELEALAEGEEPRTPMDLVRMRPLAPTSTAKKGWSLPMDLGFEPGAIIGSEWRR